MCNAMTKFIPQGFPIPVNSNLLGAEMVLWETQRGQQDKVGFLRYKAPALAENTYAFGSDTTGYYSAFARTFAYLDGQFDALVNGFRVDEAGVTRSIGDIFATDTETSMDMIQEFADTLTLMLVVNQPGITARYTAATFAVNPTGTRITDEGRPPTNSSAKMPAMLSFSPTSPELGANGYLVIRTQAFDKSDFPVGEPLVRRYWCQPFEVVVAGTLRMQDLAGMGTGVSFGPHVNAITLFTEGVASVALTSMSASAGCSSVRYAIGGNVTAQSPALALQSQLVIKSSTDIISIACFCANGRRVGRVWSAHFNSNLDAGIYNGAGSLGPENKVGVEPIPVENSWSATQTTPGNTTLVIADFLAAAPWSIKGTVLNTSVKLTVTVVGGSGAAGAGTGGGGGGAGGVAVEVYYDLLTCYEMTLWDYRICFTSSVSSVCPSEGSLHTQLRHADTSFVMRRMLVILDAYYTRREVGAPGQQSSVSFADTYRSLGAGRGSNQGSGQADTGSYPIRSTQDPIYPTIALAGADAVGPTAGARGRITKGSPGGRPDMAGSGFGSRQAGAGGSGVQPAHAGDVTLKVELLTNSTSY